MALAVFPFALQLPGDPQEVFHVEQTPAEAGAPFVLALQDIETVVIPVITVRFPNRLSGLTQSDLSDFWRSVQGPTLPFLVKVPRPVFHIFDGTIAVATGAEDTFPLAMRYPIEVGDSYETAATFEVWANGVPQASGWSITGNTSLLDAAPQLVFTSNPAAGPIRVRHAFRTAMRFDSPNLPGRMIVPGSSLSKQGADEYQISLAEWAPGNRYASVLN